MESINNVPIELTVVLGDSTMPVNHLLKMGRGAVIELNTLDNEEVQILANNTPIAKGDVIVKDDRIAISITGKIGRDKSKPKAA
jgi:flagellar motor switch protein FliN/FliY